MSSSKRRFFAGNSIEQALVLAARHFRLEPERLAYRLVEKRHGFLRFPRRLVIEIDPANPQKAEAPVAAEASRAAAVPRAGPSAPQSPRIGEAAPGSERPQSPERPAAPISPPRPTAPPRPPVPQPANPAPVAAPPPPSAATAPPASALPDDVLARGRGALDAILRLAGLQLEPHVRLEDGVLWVNLSGPDRELLLDDEAELLQAIEYLLRRTLVPGEGVRGEGEGLRCRVDTDGFREGREEELRRLAVETAAAVRASRQPVRLEAMSPAERRIIHLALAEHPGVKTESEGEGYFKRVMVQPA